MSAAVCASPFSELLGTAQQADFICIDTETANERRSSLCAIGIAIVADGQVVAKAAEVIDPECEFNSFNSMVNGLDADAVINARTLPEVWPEFAALVSGRPMVFHNAGFDVGVLRASAARYGLDGFAASVICSMRLARRVWPTAPSYGLSSMATDLSIDLNHHEAGSDANACAAVTLAAISQTGVTGLEQLQRKLGMESALVTRESFIPAWTDTAESLNNLAAKPDADPSNPLFGATVCFTGALLSMIRRDAAELVHLNGGEFVNNLSAKVTYLVVGDLDYLEFADGNRTGKLEKAASLRAKGKGPEIIREVDFFRMLR